MEKIDDGVQKYSNRHSGQDFIRLGGFYGSLLLPCLNSLGRRTQHQQVMSSGMFLLLKKA